jgi:hypothetical protein
LSRPSDSASGASIRRGKNQVIGPCRPDQRHDPADVGHRQAISERARDRKADARRRGADPDIAAGSNPRAAPVQAPAMAAIVGTRTLSSVPSTRSIRSSYPQAKSSFNRSIAVANVTTGSVVGGRPAGCPRAFCGCGASLRVFGRIVPELDLAASWLRFPRTSPAAGMVAARRGHVFVLEQHLGGDTCMAYDANSGGHATRIHARALRGYTIVNPHARLT